MNTFELCLRNYYASLGAPAEIIEAIIAQGQNDAIIETIAAMITGPYGSLVPYDPELTDDQVDAGLEGYVKALEEVIQHIDNSQIQVPCEGAATSVHQVLGLLKRDIQNRIADVTREDEEDPVTTLEDLLSAFLGVPVTVVDLESPQG